MTLINTMGQNYVLSLMKNHEKGVYTKEVDLSQFSDGIYFCNIRIGSFSITKKLVISQNRRISEN